MINIEAGTPYNHAVPIAYKIRHIVDSVFEIGKFLVKVITTIAAVTKNYGSVSMTKEVFCTADFD